MAMTATKPTKKKKKVKPKAHYLAPTAASKAMRRDKSPVTSNTMKPTTPGLKMSPMQKTLKKSETSPENKQ